MTQDIVLITVESWRYDHRQYLGLPDGFETRRGITMGHYTRPGLAGLLTGRYRDAVQARPDAPTLASRLQAAGYTTLGISHSPQTAQGMGFGAGFDAYEAIEADNGPLARGTTWREQLARFGPLRALHRRLKPKGATLANIPADDSALQWALCEYRQADSPKFLWVHLMDTHRPYGRGDDALPSWLDSKAAAASQQDALTPAEHEEVVSTYRSALRRAGNRVNDFLRQLGSAPVVAIVGDHGEEFGEQAYYYHGGYRQRLVDSLVEVPLAVRNLPICGEQVGMVDLAPTLLSAAGADTEGLDGVDRQWHPSPGALTVAPWAGQVEARWTGPATSVYLTSDGARSVFSKKNQPVPDGVSEQLKALGYSGTG